MTNLINSAQMPAHTSVRNEFLTIVEIVQNYTDGLHFGDVEKLKSIFHEDVVLKAPNLRRNLEDWLLTVQSRDVPAELGLPYDFEIQSIDIIRDQAMVKLRCPLFEYQYIDFIGFLKEGGQWKIVSKMYCDVM
ncbi:MAG: hypothetical protein ACI93R_002123 [Flavobacteriales bacterium]|jgi:hypothetical protein